MSLLQSFFYYCQIFYKYSAPMALSGKDSVYGIALKNLICRFAAGVGCFDHSMSEFKFSCPVCGQHIMGDPGISGMRIECPTCYQKIIVPQPPAEGSKFVLSATQAIKPRVIPPVPLQQNPVLPPPRRTGIPAGIVLLVFVLSAAGVFALYNFLKSEKPRTGPGATSASSKSSVPDVAWTLDLTNAFPGWNAAGKIHGKDFICERATLTGGTLVLREGAGQTPELALNVILSARLGEELSEKSVNVLSSQTSGVPRVILRWKEMQQPINQPIATGYAMKLEFGLAANGRIPGKIYICLPDASQSTVAGTFNAEIRKPRPPATRQQQPPIRRN